MHDSNYSPGIWHYSNDEPTGSKGALINLVVPRRSEIMGARAPAFSMALAPMFGATKLRINISAIYFTEN